MITVDERFRCIQRTKERIGMTKLTLIKRKDYQREKYQYRIKE